MKKQDLIQMLKFTLFSISAGVIQFGVSAILMSVINLDYWISYLTGLILSIVWNFTINRRFTFKSAANVPIAMAKVFLFYLVFTPVSTFLGDLAESNGIHELIVLGVTMIFNFVLEFLYCKFIVYKNQENTINNSHGN